MSSFQTLNLDSQILTNVATVGYKNPTPIQSKVIPSVLLGKDLLATAQTGTGKTASYLLPLATQLLKHNKLPKKQTDSVLILTPTRELAAQVLEHIDMLTQDTALKATAIFGGVSINVQKEKIQSGIHFLVATPGRLLDLVQQRAILLDETSVLVLDEADRMLDMGFIHDIHRILKLLPQKRQTLLFSATFSADIRTLAQSFMQSPLCIELNSNKATLLVRQTWYRMPEVLKREAVRDLIVDNQWQQVLIFTRTKTTSDRLAKQLKEDGFKVLAIHGDKTQAQRIKALEAFKNHELPILVATDVAARGLDIEQLPQIINFELPQQAEDYVHRIGRTGRAGFSGEAFSLVSEGELQYLQDIEKFLKKKITLSDFPGFNYNQEVSKCEEDNTKKPNRAKKDFKNHKKFSQRTQSRFSTSKMNFSRKKNQFRSQEY